MTRLVSPGPLTASDTGTRPAAEAFARARLSAGDVAARLGRVEAWLEAAAPSAFRDMAHAVMRDSLERSGLVSVGAMSSLASAHHTDARRVALTLRELFQAAGGYDQVVDCLRREGDIPDTPAGRVVHLARKLGWIWQADQ